MIPLARKELIQAVGKMCKGRLNGMKKNPEARKAGKWRRIGGCKGEWQRERMREKWKKICKYVLVI